MSDILNAPAAIVEFPKLLYKAGGKSVEVRHAAQEAVARELGYMLHSELYAQPEAVQAPDEDQAVLDRIDGLSLDEDPVPKTRRGGK